jgi:hypothetical protein
MHQDLASGALDIIGDIHGELEALHAVLHTLGYDATGRHPAGRTLVFVGDLVDRGPDSPGVVALVRRLVHAGRAQAILGNHEVNLLRAARKHGNGWLWNLPSTHDDRYRPWVTTGQGEQALILDFLRTLPLALSRADLRVVHAAWHAPSLARLAGLDATTPPGELFTRLDQEAGAQLAREGWAARAASEKSHWRQHFADPANPVPMLEGIGRQDAMRQMLNPLRVLTSGVERPAAAPFFASGQWRFAERVRWWDDYADEVPVVVGHYWRRFLPVDRARLGKGDPDLFEGVEPLAWLGRRGRVFCIDYSVGGRHEERRHGSGAGQFRTRLAALRWPERTVVLDSGQTLPTSGYAAG